MASRFVSTSRLSNIIQMITLAGTSGILRVIRGHGNAREMGQIQFVNGEPVSALLGTLTGNSALNVLANWGECVYSFEEGAHTMPAAQENSFTSGEMPSYASRPSPTSGALTGSWPTYGYPQSPSSPSAPLPSTPSLDAFGSYPSTPSAPYSPPPNYSPPSSVYPGSLPNLGDPYRQGMAVPSPALTGAPPTSGLQPEILRAVPLRTRLSEHIEQLPLDRRERMVLMLVDGQRSVADLVRLTRRGEQDLYAVLTHLNMLGLLQYR